MLGKWAGSIRWLTVPQMLVCWTVRGAHRGRFNRHTGRFVYTVIFTSRYLIYGPQALQALSREARRGQRERARFYVIHPIEGVATASRSWVPGMFFLCVYWVMAQRLTRPRPDLRYAVVATWVASYTWVMSSVYAGMVSGLSPSAPESRRE
jgi:hypothetical protein